jgi:hypothetical protein
VSGNNGQWFLIYIAGYQRRPVASKDDGSDTLFAFVKRQVPAVERKIDRQGKVAELDVHPFARCTQKETSINKCHRRRLRDIRLASDIPVPFPPSKPKSPSMRLKLSRMMPAKPHSPSPSSSPQFVL